MARRLLLPVPWIEVRSRRPRVQGLARADQPGGAALHAGGRQAGHRRRRKNQGGIGARSHAKWLVAVVRFAHALGAPGMAEARRRLLRAEELQLLVLLRLARAARAGDPDRLGHLPDDEL